MIHQTVTLASAGADKFLRDLLCDVTNMSDPQSSICVTYDK